MLDSLPTAVPDALALLATVGLPALYALAALLAPVGASGDRLFRRAGVVTQVALGLAALQLALGLVAPVALSGPLAAAIRIDWVTRVMLALVAFIAFVIVRFSRAYLGADPGVPRYVRWMMATLAAVTVIAVSNHLLVMVLAWTATSLSLHQLLTFYRRRPKALIAAHKKFIVSRLADACFLGACAILASHVGALDLDSIATWADAQDGLPLSAGVATWLFVTGAGLRTAQLPFHGWLTQVMEAPTPVSALLHAGVVNLGGFVLIRLAPLLEAAPIAQMLLVFFGTLTAVVAALVMTTRTSVKISLAWSTVAQMGFMMLQCGLGAYGLAFLHLVAHSLYKAHAFLSTGSTVERWRVHALSATPAPSRSVGHWVGAAALGLVAVAAVAWVGGIDPVAEPTLLALGFVLSLATTPLLVRSAGPGLRGALLSGAFALLVTSLYVGWHALFGSLVATADEASLLRLAPRLAVVLVGFAVLFGLQATMAARPDGRLARALHPVLYAGLYVDEIFTRATFRIWPARSLRHLPTRPIEAVEA